MDSLYDVTVELCIKRSLNKVFGRRYRKKEIVWLFSYDARNNCYKITFRDTIKHVAADGMLNVFELVHAKEEPTKLIYDFTTEMALRLKEEVETCDQDE